jgi:uncharacterized protein with PhoU and TrkA domain
MKGEHASRILDLEDKIDKLTKEIELNKTLAATLNNELDVMKV